MFFGATFVSFIIAMALVGFIVSITAPSSFSGSFDTQGPETIKLPGGVSINVDELEKSAKDFEKSAKDLEKMFGNN